jgi:hypothetical protein
MKEEGTKYPKYKGLTEKWLYENGDKKKVNLENCPLYIEIQKHLGNK